MGTALLLGATMVVILKMSAPSSNLSFNEKIAVIPIEGTISASREITSELVRLKKDKKIKAIILRINSPGGAVGPTQEIYEEVRKTARTKKVIASMGGVAASGGYYIAAAANKIVANPGTITGSIGVIMGFARFRDLLDKIGIQFEIVKSGEFKDIGSPYRKMTERERELINSVIGDIQEQFVEGVASGRNLSVEEVLKIADGRVLSGTRAKGLGLVDVLGNFQDAVELAKEMSGIKGNVILVYPKKTMLELWDLFIKTAVGSVINLFQNTGSQGLEYRWSGFIGQ
ncbi:MAG: signal peptide peptidase SppA [Thermodesulfobacteriota bacterium]|nr:signal peptide peptidase SppA [Thermodesulfobacteriota bacterium]